MKKFKIPVVEYASAWGGAPLTTAAKTPFTVTERELIVAMVRSTLTVNSGKASRKFMASIVKPTLQFMLDWNRTPHLCIANEFQNSLRDFSGTTRIGELAQGVSYAYWTQQRGYSWITDFGPWVKGLTPKYAGTKSPDFVMLNPIENDLAVMESKGTKAGCHKVAMGEAIRQCKDAVGHPSFSRAFGTVLTLDFGNTLGRGCLHIRDPETKAELGDELRFYVFRRSYASWFDLSGDTQLAEWCRQGEEDEASSILLARLKGDMRFSESPLRMNTAAALGFNPKHTSFTLDPMIASALSSLEAFKRFDLRKWSRQLQESSVEKTNSIRFPDGTSVSRTQ